MAASSRFAIGSARKEVLKRTGLGVVYLPLYALLLYPVAFAVGVVLGIVDVGYTLVTGGRPDYAGEFANEVWSWTGGNVGYILSGDGEFEPVPPPLG